MPWNNAGDNQRPASRPANANPLEEALKRWQRRLQGGGTGGAGEGGSGPGFVLLAIAFGLWLASGIFAVDASELAVVQRFGKQVRVAGEGANWRMPWPIETVSKVNVSNRYGFSAQSRMLTSDVNLVSISYAIQFQYADPISVLFQVRDPQGTLNEVSESAIREVVGGNTLDAVLAGASRRAITLGTQELIQRTLDSYKSGIRVTSVNLTDVQVPEEVVASQRDANKAIEDKERYSQEAQAYANDILPKARGAAQRQVLDASAYRQQIVAQAEGDASRFSQLAQEYAAAPEVTRNRLYLETVETVYSNTNKVIIDARSGGNNMLYLPLDKLMESARSAAPSGGRAAVSVEAIPDSSSAAGASDARNRERVER